MDGLVSALSPEHPLHQGQYDAQRSQQRNQAEVVDVCKNLRSRIGQ